jgi:aminoglycoside 6'-N-acetyltransferase
MKLRMHQITLRENAITLRPMSEADWEILLKWNSDPDVLYYSEGDDVAAYSMAEIQSIYRGVSQTAFCFIIELDGQPIGEGWLQEMNIERILLQHPDQDCRRIDLMIGEKQYWGRGYGSAAIRALTRFGFEREGADSIWGCFVADYNPRSLKAFQKVGYEIVAKIEQPPGQKARHEYDLAIDRTKWYGQLTEAACDGQYENKAPFPQSGI